MSDKPQHMTSKPVSASPPLRRWLVSHLHLASLRAGWRTDLASKSYAAQHRRPMAWARDFRPFGPSEAKPKPHWHAPSGLAQAPSRTSKTAHRPASMCWKRSQKSSRFRLPGSHSGKVRWNYQADDERPWQRRKDRIAARPLQDREVTDDGLRRTSLPHQRHGGEQQQTGQAANRPSGQPAKVAKVGRHHRATPLCTCFAGIVQI